jgi:glutamyl-tRNA reductase
VAIPPAVAARRRSTTDQEATATELLRAAGVNPAAVILRELDAVTKAADRLQASSRANSNRFRPSSLERQRKRSLLLSLANPRDLLRPLLSRMPPIPPACE